MWLQRKDATQMVQSKYLRLTFPSPEIDIHIVNLLKKTLT